MFGSNENEEVTPEVRPQSEDTIIGKTIKIEGDLVSNGDIIVEGEVVGTLKTEKTLRVGQNAKVTADIKATIALIAGEVTGNMDVSEKVELTDTAKVNGDIKTKIISVNGGAKFNGRCEMDEGVNVVADNVATDTSSESENKGDESSSSNED